jgi:RNA polymerase-binding transcription factor DksA
MTVAELEHFRDLLTQRREGLQGWLNLNEPEYADGAGRVRGLLTDIKDALSRIDSGFFGVVVVDREVAGLPWNPTLRVGHPSS